MALNGRRPGASPRRPSPTPITRCLPEALETWPVQLMERLLPRHMQIIYLINAMHLDALRAKGASDAATLSSVSLIDEHNGRHVRMGHLAFLGSHKVNGVSALHSELVKETVFKDFHRALSRPHRQQDQWRHLPPLAARGQSAAVATARRHDRRWRLRRARTTDRTREVRRRRRVPEAIRGGQAREQGASRDD